ncbi:endocuticle structural glycoprotein SgAbd-5-like isoform X2 [Plutella xylostella]|uniref:endocuticle structural glycoprotein SgAbd-5-like isoform X2 n=1 Tax=Plutella xylostella TaxID=51655 RepID=UPI00203317DC|nr:endocuticle structural glycoprotein SgAbd-5-like isoform X2 [Plutella xylostella]
MIQVLLVFFVAAVLKTSTARSLSDTDLLKYTFNNNGHGSYSFEYETSDGTYRREDGGVVNDVWVVRGEYGYTDPQGRRYSVLYVADDKGFQPLPSEGDTRLNDRRIV